MLKKAKKCDELSNELLAEMRAGGYSSRSVDTHFRSVYNCLIKFCDEHFEGMYSVEAGESFMMIIKRKKLSKDQTALYRNSIERLNHAVSGNFQWRPEKQHLKPFESSSYDSIIARYESYLFQTGKTNTNVRHHIHSVSRFLAHMESIGIVDISMIKAEHVHEEFKAANDKAGFHKTIKMFFRYAYKYELIENDISCWIPSIPRHKPVPTVYKAQEIEKILSSIDRTSCIGKRDYCIVLIAAKLGIRSCDIAGLNLDAIHCTEGIIRFTQQKTNVSIEFPILPEISTALDDYLNNARPDSCLPNVFLTKPRPVASVLSTQGIYAIVSEAIAKSGIDTTSRRHGTHALRSSLASQLLSDGKTYSEIQQVLGQTSLDVAQHYVRVETERLRECALEVPDFHDEAVVLFLKGR